MELFSYEASSEEGDGQADYVVLREHKISVKSDAQVLAQVAEYVLNTYPVPAEVEETCGFWLTADPAAAQAEFGYFRGSPRHVRTKTRSFWVGTSSNTAAKQRQMKTLCQLAGVDEGEILWVKKGKTVFASGM